MSEKNNADFSTYKDLAKVLEAKSEKNKKEIKKMVDNIYGQLESLSWLQRVVNLKYPLPPLRGWPASPDFLLKLHRWITTRKPNVVCETGSGVTTLVIADALRQNGFGKLVSIEHSEKYANTTMQLLSDEFLSSWVDLRVNPLVPWYGKHLNSSTSQMKSLWYEPRFDGVENIELLVIDGPPEGTCPYARYPALHALKDRLAPSVEVWMDDTKRENEKIICQQWAEEFGFKLNFYDLDKGLGILSHGG